MTNAELIQKIRSEIERRRNYISVTHFAEELLSILSALESKKPMNQDEELNNEIKAFVNEYGYEKSEDILLIAIVARHFAQWQKEQMLKEAVDADILLTLHDKTGDISLHTGYLPKELGIKYGDRVRIIIVKEEEK